MFFFIIIALAAIGLVVFGLSDGGTFKRPLMRPVDPKIYQNYRTVDSLFVNAHERAFFYTLSQALKTEALDTYQLMSKVRLEDVVGVSPQIKDPRTQWQLRGRIKSRHVDFLIVNDYGRPVCVIELDGSAHQDAEQKRIDAFKDTLFKTCELVCVRVKTGDDFDAISKEICRKLKP